MWSAWNAGYLRKPHRTEDGQNEQSEKREDFAALRGGDGRPKYDDGNEHDAHYERQVKQGLGTRQRHLSLPSEEAAIGMREGPGFL